MRTGDGNVASGYRGRQGGFDEPQGAAVGGKSGSYGVLDLRPVAGKLGQGGGGGIGEIGTEGFWNFLKSDHTVEGAKGPRGGGEEFGEGGGSGD